ncbi:hypothetical protein LNO36_22615 [Klebsiella variicola subsp. variicola]|nr:hypothetical protein [Klebsiella variicola subsp. variicola]
MPALSLSLSVAEKVRLTAGMGMWSTHPIPHSTLGSVTLSDGPMGITGGRVDERDIALLSPCGAGAWRQLGPPVGQPGGRRHRSGGAAHRDAGAAGA